MKNQSKKVDINNKLVGDLSSALGSFYDRALLESILAPNPFMGEVIGYKKVKVPRYLEIKMPVIERHYDEDGEFEGWLTTFESIKLFRIGTDTIEEPIYKERKSRIVNFKRYGGVAQVEEQ